MKNICLLTLGFAGMLYAFPSCQPASSKPEKKQQQPAALPVKVGTVKATVRDFRYSVLVNGVIRSSLDEQAVAGLPGKITYCRLGPGATASKGELLLQLDTEDQQLRLEKAELVRFNAEKEFTSQLIGYERLLEEKTGAEKESIRKKLRISSGLSGAEHEIREIRHEMEKSSYYAPFGGLLTEVKVREGQRVAAGEKLYRLYAPGALFLETHIVESDLPLVHTGAKARLVPLADRSASYTGFLEAINPSIDENGLIAIFIRVPPGHGKLFPGMHCEATISGDAGKCLLVPREALVTRGDKQVVFTVKNGRTKWNYVTTGKENATEVEVLAGIQPGEEVVVSGNLELSNEAAVQATPIK